MLNSYLKNTSSDNNLISIELAEAFELKNRLETAKEFDTNKPRKAKKEKKAKKKLLWHGTRSSSLIAALSQGLKTAPAQAPNSSFLLGKGIYFADMASKALGDCYPFDNTALVLLCEVALGRIKEMKNFDCDAGFNTQKYDSVLGCGYIFPDAKQSETREGVEIPLGKPEVRNATVI